MKKIELEIQKSYPKLVISFEEIYDSFNTYKINIHTLNEEFYYKYDNHLTQDGNMYKIKEIIRDKIIEYYEEG